MSELILSDGSDFFISNKLDRYSGAPPYTHLKAKQQILNLERKLTGKKWHFLGNE